MAEKTTSITDGKDEKTKLETNIAKLEEDREKLDTKKKTLRKEIEAIVKEVTKANITCKKELKLYTKNEADLSAAIEALEGAIKSLKAKTEVGFVQLKGIENTVTE